MCLRKLQQLMIWLKDKTIVKSLFSYLIGICRVFVVKLKVKTYHPLSKWASCPLALWL